MRFLRIFEKRHHVSWSRYSSGYREIGYTKHCIVDKIREVLTPLLPRVLQRHRVHHTDTLSLLQTLFVSRALVHPLAIHFDSAEILTNRAAQKPPRKSEPHSDKTRQVSSFPPPRHPIIRVVQGMPPSCRFLSVHLAPVQVSARMSGALFPNGDSPVVLLFSKFSAIRALILVPDDLQSPPPTSPPTCGIVSAETLSWIYLRGGIQDVCTGATLSNFIYHLTLSAGFALPGFQILLFSFDVSIPIFLSREVVSSPFLSLPLSTVLIRSVFR